MTEGEELWSTAGFVGRCSGEASPSLCLFQKDLWDSACPPVPFIKACQQEGISKHLKRRRSGMNVTNTAGGPAVSLLPMAKKAFNKTWNLNIRLVTCIMPQFNTQIWKTLLSKPFWTICILQLGHFPSSRCIFLLSKLELLQEEEQQYINRKILLQLHEEFCADILWPPLSTTFLLARRSRRIFDCYLEVRDTAYYHPHLRIRIQTSVWRPEEDALQLMGRQWG